MDYTASDWGGKTLKERTVHVLSYSSSTLVPLWLILDWISDPITDWKGEMKVDWSVILEAGGPTGPDMCSQIYLHHLADCFLWFIWQRILYGFRNPDRESELDLWLGFGSVMSKKTNRSRLWEIPWDSCRINLLNSQTQLDVYLNVFDILI